LSRPHLVASGGMPSLIVTSLAEILPAHQRGWLTVL
jgi:hypothetical protein